MRAGAGVDLPDDVATAGAIVRSAADAQVFVDDPAAPAVGPGDGHHLVRVLRLRPGDAVIAADGRGRWVRCRLRAAAVAEEEGDMLEPEGPVIVEPAPAPLLTVAFAPVKGDRPEWVVQKLTELGIDRIVPLLARRSVVRWEGDRSLRAVERLRRVAREAAAQSRRVWLPEVTAVQAPGAFVAEASASGDAVDLAQLGGPPAIEGATVIAVGPEGGWSPDELSLGRGTVGLGPNVLRAETAAVVAGAVLGALRSGAAPTGASRAAVAAGGPEVGEWGVAGETEWLSTKEAAARLGVALRSLYRFIDEGELVAYKFGRVIRLKQSDVDRFVEACRIAPGDLEHLYPSRPTDGEGA